MIDNKTAHLKFPLPHEANELQDDLPRLRQALNTLDAHAKATDEDKAGRNELATEAAARQAGDAALQESLHSESGTRKAADDLLKATLAAETAHRESDHASLAADLDTEIANRAEADTAERQAREDALQAHEGNASAHDALIRRITVGDVSPIIGICQLETGNCTGLWYNCDAEGQPITPNARYFDYHPVYSAMRRVLVDGQVMVENKPFWIKTFRPASGPFQGKLCRVISPGPAEGFRPYPAFLSQSGAVLDNMYIGAYAGTDEGSSKIGSRPGKLPIVSLDFPTMQTRCANRNTGGVSGFRMWDFHQYSALCLLFLIEHATTESQLILGRGHVDSSGATYTDAGNQPQWRGYVGLYGNVWQMVDGFRLTASRQIELFKADGSRAWTNTGKVSPSYDGTNAAYVVTNHTGASNGFFLDDFFLPATQSTSYTAGTFPDHFYGGSGSAGNVLYVGGVWSYASGAGLFCWYLSSPGSYASSSIGCRLARC